MIMKLLDNSEEINDNIIKKEEPIVPVIEYWINTPAIDANIGVKNINWGGWTLIKAITFIRAATNGLQYEQYIGFWFKPAWFTVTAVRDGISSNICISSCVSDVNNSKMTTYLYWWKSWWSSKAIFKIDYRDDWWWITEARLNTILDDWIELNIIDSDENIKFTITAYNN